MFKPSLFLATVFVAVLGLFNSVFGSCGCSQCSLSPNTPLSTTKWTFGLSYEEINQNHPFLGDKGASVGQVALHHDEVQTINKLWTASIAGPILDRWSFFGELPWVSRTHSHIHHHGGGTINERWDYGGWGDVTVGTRYPLFSAASPEQIVLSTAITVPTGVTNVTNSDGDEAEASIQPGTGGYSTSWGVLFQTTRVPVVMSAFFTTYGRGKQGWKFGEKWQLNLGTEMAITSQVSGELQLNTVIQNRADAGQTGEPISTTGGTTIWLTPVVNLHLLEGIQSYILVQLPLYRNVNSLQITADMTFKTGLSAAF